MNSHIDFQLDEDIDLEPDNGPEQADPFGEALTPAAFYAEDSRRLSLNKLLHLAPYCEVLLVTGGAGVGKSALLDQFVRQAQPGWRAGRLEAGSLMMARDLLLQVAHALGIRLDVDPHDKEAVFYGITSFVRALGRGGRRAILIVDSAHVLAPDLLQELDALFSESGNALAIIFSTDNEYAAFLDGCPALASRIAYRMEIEGFDRAGVEGYIRHRLKAVGESDQVAQFDAAAFDRIFQESGGVARQINIGARKVLHGQSSSRVGRVSAPKAAAVNDPVVATGAVGRGRVKWAVAIAVGLLVVGTVLYWQDEINSLFELPTDATVKPKESAEVGGGDIRRLNLIEQTLAPEVTVKPLDLAPVVEPEVIDTPVEDETVVLDVVDPPAEEVVEVSPPAVIEPEVLVEPAPAPPAKIIAKPSQDPVPMAPSPVLVGETWLRSQGGERFTMQLMALHDEAKVRRLVKSFGLAGEHSIYRVKRNGDALFVVVYGSYPDRELAMQASDRVPKSWGVGRPWVRKVREVRSDLGMAP